MTAARVIVALAIALASLTAAETTEAQTLHGDTAAPLVRAPTLRMAFERNVNTFTWDCAGLYALREGSWEATVNERFQRTLIKAEQESIKDEQLLVVEARRRLFGTVSLAATASSFLFTDNKSLGLSDVSTNRFLAGLRWQPLDFWILQPLAGVTFDRQQGFLDGGFSFDATSTIDRILFGNSMASGELLLSESQLSPRYQKEQKAGGRLLTTFGSASDNQLLLQVRRVHRDFYTENASAISSAAPEQRFVESRAEQSIYAADQLRYQASENAIVLAGVDALQRSIDKRRTWHDSSAATPFFDASIDEFRLNGSLDGRLALPHTLLTARLDLFERTETHGISDFSGSNPVSFLRQQKLEEQKNNSITQMQLSLGAVHGFSAADSLSVVASTVKMTYDTPSSQNSDDRDELWFLAGSRFVHRFSSMLTAFITADVNLRHTVYIFSEQSANNAWNRVLRLSPGTELRVGERWSSKLAGEVVANYTVYDFEEASAAQKSYSLRQMTITDSTSIALTRSLSLSALLHYRLSERGALAWKAFSVRPLLLYDERSAVLAIMYSGRLYLASVGFRWFLQDRFRRVSAAWREEHSLESLGPVVHMRIGMGSGMHVVFDGWYQRTRESTGDTVFTPDLSVGVLWNL